MENYNILVTLSSGEVVNIIGSCDLDLHNMDNFSKFRKVMNSYDVINVTTIEGKNLYLEINNICKWEVL